MAIEHDFKTGINDKISVGSTSTEVLSATDSLVYCVLTNDSTEEIYLSLGTPAELNKGIRLNRRGGSWNNSGEKPYRGAVYAICTTGGKNLCIQRG